MKDRPTSVSARPVPSIYSETLETPVQFVKGVGPIKAEILKKIDIETVRDLLFYYPRDHQDRHVLKITALRIGQKATVRGRVEFSEFKQVGKMLGQARAVLKDGSGAINAIWFKRFSYKYDVFATLKKYLVEGSQWVCYGTVDAGQAGLELRVEDAEVIPPEASAPDQRIVPVYPLTEGLQDRWLRILIETMVSRHAHLIWDPLPQAVRDTQNLLPLAGAMRAYHSPASWTERDRARERLAFDEFFFLELALAQNRQNREAFAKGFVSHPVKNLLTPFKAKLGYEFTKAQARVINEIFRDMARDKPMNRLLQGDVGSGKTVVALSAALLAIENGRQSAFLAPTEILAEQHALSMTKYFAGLPVRSALLTGSTPPAERKKIIADLKQGKIQLLVGTHALLDENVTFERLGLVVIDEQHRFGVRQRAQLLQKSATKVEGGLLQKTHPDVLIMTATPIPRTLALTLYGDLDVSVIDELPAGRTPIRSSLANEAHAMTRVEVALNEGRQAYVVFPLIGESEALAKRSGKAVKAATLELEKWKTRFPNANIGLLHGQIKPEEKKRVMDSFRKGEISILVATPVIEVGIDVPNATVIAIMNPERFGLAQLHQLRGRVGRGRHASECLLVDDAPETANERLQLFCHVADGFKLAEEDLRLRGPGEFIGEAQHGIPFFRVGNLLQDALLIAQARNAAQALTAGEMPLTMKEFNSINQTLSQRFGAKLKLTGIG